MQKQIRRPPRFSIHLLGPFRIYQNDRQIETWPGQKGKSIFKYLVVNRQGAIHREVLMDLFWQGTEPEAARKNLHQAIYSLRQTLQDSYPNFAHILFEQDRYLINPEINIWVDSEAFLKHYQTGLTLLRDGRQATAYNEFALAENLYKGEFLHEDRYEEWLLVERENLKHTYLEVLQKLSLHYFKRREYTLCIAYCQKNRCPGQLSGRRPSALNALLLAPRAKAFSLAAVFFMCRGAQRRTGHLSNGSNSSALPKDQSVIRSISPSQKIENSLNLN